MKTKIVIALITVVAFGVLATGIVLAHDPTLATPYADDPSDPNSGYYGWGRGCYGSNQQYYRYQPPTQNSDTAEQPQPPVPPQPNKPVNPDYYYPSSYGRGCWGW